MFFIILAYIFTVADSVPILGGSDVLNLAKYKFVAHIEFARIIFENDTHLEEEFSLCTGSVLAPNVILTAAHCFTATIAEPEITVRVGMLRRSQDKNVPTSIGKEYIIHSDYIGFNPNGISIYNDIALLWLETPFSSHHIEIATLASPLLKVKNVVGEIVGWGITSSGYHANNLQNGEIKVIDTKPCKNLHFSITTTKSLLCILSDTNKIIPCMGDSGGPLIVNSVVVAIAAASYEDRTFIRDDGEKVKICNPKIPAVYTEVSSFRKWIDQNLIDGPPKSKKDNKKKTNGKSYIDPAEENSTLDKDKHNTGSKYNPKKKSCIIL